MFAQGITAYQAYGESVGWVNFQGDPMPRWDDLPPPIKQGWVCAAEAVLRQFRGDD